MRRAGVEVDQAGRKILALTCNPPAGR
jgi:hypothetical protein